MHGHCERARQWASADVDGELSTFERALLKSRRSECRHRRIDARKRIDDATRRRKEPEHIDPVQPPGEGAADENDAVGLPARIIDPQLARAI